MRRENFLRLLFSGILPASVLSLSCTGTPPPLTVVTVEKRVNRTPLDPEVAAKMWRVHQGKVLSGTGEELRLQGIAFTNEVYEGSQIPSGHHSSEDYERVATMGMNTVRFYLNYRTFEDDDAPYEYKESGFQWIDQNVEWAKSHNIRLILNMGVPVGGDQSRGTGTQLWDDDETQKRFLELWKTIAERYRAEPQIVGYDLLNAPWPTKSIQQWVDLAEKTVVGIREVDQQHILLLDAAIATAGDSSDGASQHFIEVKDPNVIYGFHFEQPFQFTRQNAKWSESVAREGWYPDANIPEAEARDLELVHSAESGALPPHSSSWSTLETAPYLVDSEKIVIAKPVLVCDASVGSASFDRLSVVKVSPQQLEVKRQAEQAEQDLLLIPEKKRPWFSPKQIREKEEALSAQLEPEVVFDIDLDTYRGWSFYSKDGTGVGEFITRGNGDFTALSISGTTGSAYLSSESLRFVPETGAQYQLKATARGIDLGDKAHCLIRLEMYSSKFPVFHRDKDFLRHELGAYLSWGKERNVPLYVSEVGTIKDSFLPGRGGEKWVEDMLSLMDESALSFFYLAYHSEAFGLYSNPQSLPQESHLNRPLRDVLLKALTQKGKEKAAGGAGLTEEAEESTDDVELDEDLTNDE